MPAVTRELKITYGSFEIAGTTERLLDGKIQVRKNYIDVTVQFDFTISAASEAAFATEIAVVEAAFRTPRQRLLIEQGSETLYDFDPDSMVNTGFNQAPEILKEEDVVDSGRTRRYTVRIELQVPADLSGQAGRQDSTVTFDFTPGEVRKLTLEGTYTALLTNDATAQYNASIDAYATVVQTAVGGVWELDEETTRADDTDKILEFRRVYNELVFNQSLSTLDDTDIIRQQLIIRRNRIAPGDSRASVERRAGGSGVRLGFGAGGTAATPRGGGAKVRRLVRITAEYTAWLDKDSLSATNEQRTAQMKAKWDTTVRPWIIANMKQALGTSVVAIVDEEPGFEPQEGILSARMEMVGRESGGGNVIEFEFRQQIRGETGAVLIPVWTGNPFSRYKFPGPKRAILQETRRFRVLEPSRLSQRFGKLESEERSTPKLQGETGSWHLINKDLDESELLIGVPPESFTVTDVLFIEIWEFADAVEGSGNDRETVASRPITQGNR